MQADNKSELTFDGVYFMPAGEDGEDLEISYFEFRNDMANGTPIVESPIGNSYHIAFFKEGPDGSPEFDASFEAILACPKTYIESLAGARVYGCAVKKTDKSGKWFEDYLKRTLGHITIKKLIGVAKMISETK
jgi:hypothetical protein